MSTSADRYAVDTSVAIACLDAAHGAHDVCRSTVRRLRPGLSGHAAFETFSVLTRRPGQVGLDPHEAAQLIGRVFPRVLGIDGDGSAELLERFGAIGVAGGAVCDGLVAEAARRHGCVLLTRDQRARRTYDLVGVDWELVGLP